MSRRAKARWRVAWMLLLALTGCSARAAAGPHQTQNVFLIISDGLRWQEVFSGAEEALVTKALGGVKDTNAVRTAFWRDTPEARRAALLPFFWGEIARRGQLLGNRAKGSLMSVTNGKNFSYPGYNEILTGAPDPQIDSNDKRPNPNVTVFEWLNGRSGFRGRAVVFGTWDVFPYIFNCDRSRLPIWPPWEARFKRREIAPPRLLDDLVPDTTPIGEDVTYDSFLFHATMSHLERHRPRVVFVGFGETDEWAHAGRYDQYLTAIQHMDRFVGRLWKRVQGLAQYRSRTTFLITADHGRGSGASEWKDHGENVAGAEADWLAVIGPDTAPLGERTGTAARTESQIAATIAALLGEDYRAAFPQAGAPIAEILGPTHRE